jgi:hypothetical protein
MSDPVSFFFHAVGSAALCGVLLNHAVVNVAETCKGANKHKRIARAGDKKKKSVRPCPRMPETWSVATEWRENRPARIPFCCKALSPSHSSQVTTARAPLETALNPLKPAFDAFLTPRAWFLARLVSLLSRLSFRESPPPGRGFWFLA